MLVVIKGSRTSVTPPLGVLRRRDVGVALSRIASDAKVDDCLLGCELVLLPDGGARPAAAEAESPLTKEEVLKTFPDLVPLT